IEADSRVIPGNRVLEWVLLRSTHRQQKLSANRRELCLGQARIQIPIFRHETLLIARIRVGYCVCTAESDMWVHGSPEDSIRTFTPREQRRLLAATLRHRVSSRPQPERTM